MELVIGIILIVMAVFLVVAVLLQSGKSQGLSGSIAGGAETFFGKSKGNTWDKMLSKLTTVVAIVFTLLVLFSYFIQDDPTYENAYQKYLDEAESESVENESAEQTEAGTEGTEADAE